MTGHRFVVVEAVGKLASAFCVPTFLQPFLLAMFGQLAMASVVSCQRCCDAAVGRNRQAVPAVGGDTRSPPSCRETGRHGDIVDLLRVRLFRGWTCGIAEVFGGEEREQRQERSNQLFRLRLRSGPRQGGSAFGAVFLQP